jgi:hypothetical protein
MATRNRKRRMHRVRPQHTEETDPPDSFVEGTGNDNPGVVDIEHWRKRPPNDIPVPTAKTKPTVEDATPAGRARKQAVLLRLILSDEITEKELDALLDLSMATK